MGIKHFWCILFLLCTGAFAQTSNGYLVGGFGRDTGASKAVSQFAAGGEWVAWKSLGVGAEIGASMGHGSFGMASFNGYYHFPPINPDKKLDPFVTAGYTAGIELFDAGSLFNFGFGANYWALRHFGLRGEFRDMVAGSGQHIWGFRFGVALH